MHKMIRSVAPILLVSEHVGDTDLVKSMLEKEFGNIEVSTNPKFFADDFDKQPADVLILIFHDLEKAEQHCLALSKKSQKVQRHPHRTVALCGKDEVREAYDLCRSGLFDDYVLFWPMTHDSPRLLMAVHLALRELAAARNSGPTVEEFAAQARHIASLESTLARHMAQGEKRIQNTMSVAVNAERQVGSALDGFSRRMADGGLWEALEMKNAAGLGKVFDRFKEEEMHPPLRAVGKAAEPLVDWVAEFRADVEPHMEAARSLTSMSKRDKLTVLVVEDDDLQRKLVGILLHGDDYRLLFAVSGLDALDILRKVQPDLILMDVSLPDMDGLETTRKIKAMPAMAQIPVIMVSGKGEGSVVKDSLAAGAAGFLVKPFDHAALIGKIARVMRVARPGA